MEGDTPVNEYRSPRPEQIETRSFEIIDGMFPEMERDRPEWPVVRRMVHAAGDPSIAGVIKVHSGALEAGVGALLAGRPILTDVRMLSAGINRGMTSALGCEVVCAVDLTAVAELAREMGITRSAAAMRRMASRMAGAIVAIGNAPTALFELLGCIRSGSPTPALVVGTPVGFVGAAEAKEALVASDQLSLPYITVTGTRGGSPIAAAAVNALLRMAVQARGYSGQGGQA